MAHDHDHAGHDHGHSHVHDDAPAVDPAQQSLADALKVSFWLLRALMIALVVIYVCFSGMYQVAENEAAVVTRFGKIVGAEDGASAVKEPGFHFAPPFPSKKCCACPPASARCASTARLCTKTPATRPSPSAAP